MTARSRERDEALQTLLPHALAADPGDPQPPAGALPQRRDQRAAERVARGLSGDDEDERLLRPRSRSADADHEEPGAIGGADDLVAVEHDRGVGLDGDAAQPGFGSQCDGAQSRSSAGRRGVS